MAVAVTFLNICFRFAHEFINIDFHGIKPNHVTNTCIFIVLLLTPPSRSHLTLGFVFVEFELVTK